VALDAADQRADRHRGSGGAFRYVTESRASSNHGYDLPGAVTVTGGLLALVYGFTKAGTDGWAPRPPSSVRRGRCAPCGLRAD